jgi:sec-independent protein translocase protein TatC
MKSSGEQPNKNDQAEMTFVEHLVELRNRLLRAVLAVVVLVLALFPFANDIYAFLAAPLLRHMPHGTSMIATEVASPFLTPFKLVLVVAVFLAMPVILHQAWAFVAPGLYKQEKKLVFPLMITSSLLFYVGIAFAYFVVFPLMFTFFQAVAPEGVAIMTDISRYLDFVLKLFFAFGVAFEVPIATILLVWTGFTSPEKLVAKRPYVIVGAFVIGMLLTPPDMISQTLLALPMWGLFELGVVFSRFYVADRGEQKAVSE